MKPRTQLVLVFSLLTTAIAYNAWVFLRPAQSSGPARVDAPLLDGLMAGGPSVTGEGQAEVIDPTTVPPVPDVGLDRRPEWPRNPFLGSRLQVETTPVIEDREPEPELVLASILHSAERRLAIVNGRIVRVGDRIGAVTVREIEPRAVVLESPGGVRQTLELRVPVRRVEP